MRSISILHMPYFLELNFQIVNIMYEAWGKHSATIEATKIKQVLSLGTFNLEDVKSKCQNVNWYLVEVKIS